ncbi:MAG: hypothetical protein GXO78_04425 [Calditrichaeota bacterium]|nr:hypothetical protein [Calditrichota bacterium]
MVWNRFRVTEWQMVSPIVGILMGLMGMVWLSCQKPGSQEPRLDPHPPEIRIVYPPDGATLTDTDTIRVEASDDEEIERVEIFIDGEKVAEQSHPPFQYTWYVGYWADDQTHTIQATAYDPDGNQASSDPIRVTIPASAALQPRIFAPQNDALFKNPTEILLRWSSLPDAIQYEVQVDRTDAFANPQEFTTNTYEFSFTNIQEGLFYWRVRGKNSLGRQSQWSAVYRFEIRFVVTARFSDIEQKVFARSCALSNCHTGDFPAQGLDLTPGQAYQNLVNVPSFEVPSWMLVEPNRSDRSYLITKLAGGDSLKGGLMPLNGAPLRQEVIDSIRAWIDRGALDN